MCMPRDQQRILLLRPVRLVEGTVNSNERCHVDEREEVRLATANYEPGP
jgi:hypothetical protein